MVWGASVRAAKPQAAEGGGFALLHRCCKRVFRGKTLGVLHRAILANRFVDVLSGVGAVQKGRGFAKFAPRRMSKPPAGGWSCRLPGCQRTICSRHYRRWGGGKLILFLAGGVVLLE